MVQLTIRCHPCAPVSAEELEQWLEREVDELRGEAARATIRLSRLTQRRLYGDLFVGWLLELDIPDHEPLLERPRLDDILRDMRLLGLQPTLLTVDD
jgi:hypothetical protein